MLTFTGLYLHLYTGLFEIPVSQLVPPPRESRLLREADEVFVQKLKEKMISDPSAPGATPMAVLCKDISLENFNSKHCNVYKYEVLGGLHSLLAKQQLTEAYPDNPFYKVTMAEVYVALSDEQCLRLAQRHNVNSHFVHHITHRDLVSVYHILVRAYLQLIGIQHKLRTMYINHAYIRVIYHENYS